MAGVPVMEIQRLAGHANLTTTLKYMHLAPGADQQRAMGMLEKMRSEP
jgi:site-specific recombinase XerD